jgi:hypothetical protein
MNNPAPGNSRRISLRGQSLRANVRKTTMGKTDAKRSVLKKAGIIWSAMRYCIKGQR